MNIKWSTSNSKLKKTGTIAFGIPAFQSTTGFKTCPKAGTCAAFCYARQGAYTWSTVQAAKEYNLVESQRHDFKYRVLFDLARMKKVRSIRIHDAGDFYDQTYLNKLTYGGQSYRIENEVK